MKANIKLVKKNRKFSEEFKKSIVEEFESDKFSVPQLERIHRINNSTLYNWIYKYSHLSESGQRIVEMKEVAHKS